MGVSRKQSTPNFQKNEHFLLPSGGKKCSFFGKFDVLCFLETSVLRFAFLPYYRRRILLQKVCSYKCQFCIKLCASSGLVSQVYMMAGENIKKKYLMCRISIKMLKQHAIPDSSFHNVKICSSKGCRKTSQR